MSIELAPKTYAKGTSLKRAMARFIMIMTKILQFSLPSSSQFNFSPDNSGADIDITIVILKSSLGRI